ncbi:hypothetical protein LIER_30012 [Lithospermum erythrorhizon]|uniref:Uncharacterized protein n=1 Tax=Lithospermum erythrorhizon TaxID=34254 RepID=A0AAV3RN23_LITER
MSMLPSASKGTVAQDLVVLRGILSPASLNDPMSILIVHDGLEDLSTEPLEWVLKEIASSIRCNVVLLGVMPWLNIPLSSKTWSEIWSVHREDLSIVHGEKKMKAKYQKFQHLLDLCKEYGVVPEIRTEMGHPLRLLVIEQIISLHATVVVFDRYHDRKNIEYYAEKVGCCHMVRMNDNGEAETIQGRRSLLASTPLVSPSSIPTPQM